VAPLHAGMRLFVLGLLSLSSGGLLGLARIIVRGDAIPLRRSPSMMRMGAGIIRNPRYSLSFGGAGLSGPVFSPAKLDVSLVSA
jgi:hypothetical protein